MTSFHPVAEPPSDDDSQRLFEEFQRDHLEQRGAHRRPWGGPGAPRWQRLLAMAVRAQDIRFGRFRD